MEISNTTLGLPKLPQVGALHLKGHNYVDRGGEGGRSENRQVPKHSCHLMCLGL